MKAINKVKKVWKEYGYIVVAIGGGIIVSGLGAYGMKCSYEKGYGIATTMNYLCVLADKEKYVKMVQHEVNKLPENAITWFESNAADAISGMDKVLEI